MFICKFLCGHMLSFVLGKYLGMDWLDHMADVCLTFKQTTSVFQSVCTLLHFPLAVYESFLFYILTNIWCDWSFQFNHSEICCVPVCSATQFCPALCNPMDCSPLGSSAHGIFQARILKYVIDILFAFI